MANYEHKATEYMERYGIIEGVVKGNALIYYSNYPKYLAEPRRTYKVIVNLDTMKEERMLLRRWNRRGNVNKYK